MAVPSNYAALVTAIDAILTTYGLSLFQVFGGRSTQPSLRELISLRWKLFSMTTPANYATLIAEIDVVIESYGLSLQEVFGGRSTQPTLQELIDLRYELFEVDGGASDPSQIKSTSKPTTRADGSALQQGDRWYNPNTGIEGFWNSTYWLNCQQLQYWFGPDTSIVLPTGTLRANSGEGGLVLPTFYIESIGIRGMSNLANHDGTINISVQWYYFSGISATSIGSVNTNPWGSSEYKSKETTINTVAVDCNALEAVATSNGGAVFRGQTYMKYREIL